MAVQGFPGSAEAGELIAKENVPTLTGVGEGNISIRP